MSDIFSPSPADVEGGLLCDDTLFLAPGGPELIEAGADATIDLSQLCPEIADCAELPDCLPEGRWADTWT